MKRIFLSILICLYLFIPLQAQYGTNTIGNKIATNVSLLSGTTNAGKPNYFWGQLGGVITASKSPLEVPFTIQGVLTTAAGASQGFIQSRTAGTIGTWFVKVKTAPTGTSVIFDILLNGTSIWATHTSYRPTIQVGSTTNTSGIPDTTVYPPNGVLDLLILQTDSNGIAANAMINGFIQ